MSTGHSWTELRRAVADVGTLLRFRAGGLRGRAHRVLQVALGVVGVLTVTAAVLPALLPEGGLSRSEVADLMPDGVLGLLLLAVLSAVASGGGRELLARDQAVAVPVSPTTDHLGALLMAPLNIAWLLQAWMLLAAASYVAGPGPWLLVALLPVPAWLVAATALAQVPAWAVEWVRRGPHGTLLVRLLGAVVLAGAALLVHGGGLARLTRHGPWVSVTRGVLDGAAGRWAATVLLVAALLALAVVATLLGAVLAHRVARRPAREEARVDSTPRPARPHPRSDLAALMRTDRAGVWRSVPVRRGATVLALLPGLAALAGALSWSQLTVFPGLVASGGALLFGVNAWCLDGRGALWRESLPVDPSLVFWARALVLGEILLAACLVMLGLASLRAGAPSVSEAVAVLCAALVVTAQVTATSMRWSARHPHPVDLRSARAVPAPPLAMVGYSARLALGTTVTGLAFGVTLLLGWEWSLLLAAPWLLWSGWRLRRTAAAWADPPARALVIATVAG